MNLLKFCIEEIRSHPSLSTTDSWTEILPKIESKKFSSSKIISQTPLISSNKLLGKLSQTPLISSNKLLGKLQKDIQLKKSQTAEGKDSRRPHIYRMRKMALPPLNSIAIEKQSKRSFKNAQERTPLESGERTQVRLVIQNRSNSIGRYLN